MIFGQSFMLMAGGASSVVALDSKSLSLRKVRIDSIVMTGAWTERLTRS